MPDPLVLIPGMMCDARVFGPQIAALSADAAVMVAPITGAETVERLARQVLDAAPERFALAGLSMGGIVAMEMLRQSRDRVTRLALMDTNCQAELPSVAAAREPLIVQARAGRLDEAMREQMKPEFLAPGPHRFEVMELVMDMAMTLGAEVFVQQSRALQRRPDQQATLRRANIPTLVLCGAHDTLTPVRRHEFIAHLMPLARLEVIPEAGHLPPLERPHALTRILRAWLHAPAGRIYP